MKNKIAIIIGSSSDLPIMKKTVEILSEFDIDYDMEVISAHRTPEAMVTFAKKAEQKYDVIIAGAGGAAHLPGMVASLTTLPVFGVPITSRALKGIDSLLSIAQMPKGIPVGTLAIGEAGAANAGLLAIRVLAINNKKLSTKLEEHSLKMKKQVAAMQQDLINSRESK